MKSKPAKSAISERARQRAKSAAIAASERDIALRPVVDPARRARCQADDALWLQTYLPEVFYHPFTNDQKAIIRDIAQALKFGTNKAIAAPRGDGKSSITRYLILKYALYRQIRFGLIVCATGIKADETLRSIKAQLRRRGTPLWEDFPIECDVAAYVGPAPQRGNAVTLGGRRVHCEWSANRLILPSFIDSEPIAPIVMAHGWESEQLQGCNVLDQRPDFVMLDDLDSRDSLAAEAGTVAVKIEEIVDKSIAGLGGPGRRLGQVMLCTITSSRSAAARYSDPAIKPAWSGIRLPRIKVWPSRVDRWQTYIELRQAGQNTRLDPSDLSSPAKDPFGREAFRFLQSHFEEMHAGSILSNENDFNRDLLPDGTPMHLSALQKCYDFISDNGLPAFQTEHQNAPPPPEQEIGKADISRELVQSRISGFTRRELPPPPITLAAGVDLGKYGCHWVVGAFRDGGSAAIVDYGIAEVHGVEKTEQAEIIERAIVRALSAWHDQLQADPMRDSNGNPIPLSCCLVDSGYSPDAAYEFVRRFGEPFRVAKGSSNFHHGMRSATRRVGNHWFAQPQAGRVWLYSIDPDHWKRAVHHRFLCPALDENNRPSPGSLTLFVPEGSRDHRTFGAHILAEEWVTEFVAGKGERSRWLKHSGNNHFLDATALMLAAGEMAGIGIFQTVAPRLPASERPTAQSLMLATQGRK